MKTKICVSITDTLAYQLKTYKKRINVSAICEQALKAELERVRANIKIKIIDNQIYCIY